jgi:hypothetical protein
MGRFRMQGTGCGIGSAVPIRCSAGWVRRVGVGIFRVLRVLLSLILGGLARMVELRLGIGLRAQIIARAGRRSHLSLGIRTRLQRLVVPHHVRLRAVLALRSLAVVHRSRGVIALRSGVLRHALHGSRWSCRGGGRHRTGVAQAGVNGQGLVGVHVGHSVRVPALVVSGAVHPNQAGRTGGRSREGMGSIERGSPRGGVRCHRVRRLGNLTGNRVAHRMMMERRRRLRCSRGITGLLIGSPSVNRSHGSVCVSMTTLVGGVVEKSTDVVDEEGIQQIRDLLPIGKVKRTLERNPVDSVSTTSLRGGPPIMNVQGWLLRPWSLMMSKTYQTPFRCMGPILTTCLTFSLLRIPSRRPRVIPATLSNFVPLMKWLSGSPISQQPKRVRREEFIYLHVGQRRHPWLRLGSKGFPRPPTMLPSPGASFPEVQLVPSCRTEHVDPDIESLEHQPIPGPKTSLWSS